MDFNILEAIYRIGIIPFIFGFYTIYKTVFVEKRRKLYVLIAIALVGSCATKRKAISEKDLTEAYTGTWIKKPESGYYKPKYILYPGKWEEYATIESEKPYCYGDIELIEKWTNSKGDIFFQHRFKCMTHGTTGYELLRISDSGNTMESLLTKGEKKVEEWDPDNPFYTYTIYYRQ